MHISNHALDAEMANNVPSSGVLLCMLASDRGEASQRVPTQPQCDTDTRICTLTDTDEKTKELNCLCWF